MDINFGIQNTIKQFFQRKNIQYLFYAIDALYRQFSRENTFM